MGRARPRRRAGRSNPQKAAARHGGHKGEAKRPERQGAVTKRRAAPRSSGDATREAVPTTGERAPAEVEQQPRSPPGSHEDREERGFFCGRISTRGAGFLTGEALGSAGERAPAEPDQQPRIPRCDQEGVVQRGGASSRRGGATMNGGRFRGTIFLR